MNFKFPECIGIKQIFICKSLSAYSFFFTKEVEGLVLQPFPQLKFGQPCEL